MNPVRSALLVLALGGVLVPARAARADVDREPRTFEWLRLNAGVGYQQAWMRTLMVDEEGLDARVVSEELSGTAPAVGVSCRLWLVTVGVTGRFAELSGAKQRPEGEVQLWSVDGEVSLRAPLGQLQPFVLLGGGYAALDDVGGVDLRGGLGVDYYLTSDLSLRLDGVGDLLLLGARGIPSEDDFERDRSIDTPAEARARAAEMNGTSAGAALALNAGIGLHF